MDYYTIPHETYLFVSHYLSIGDISTAYYAYARYLEGISYSYRSQYHFFEFRIKHALHGIFHIIDYIVDDSVCPYLYAFTLRYSADGRELGLTLNPIIIESDVPASIISDSLTAPTPVWTMFTLT